MKHYSIKLLSAVLLAIAGWTAADACTNLLVGKNASADGSTIITYAADSHTLFGDLQYLPAADHPAGAMREIIDWDSGKRMGAIPEVPHTYAVVGNMNEHQANGVILYWQTCVITSSARCSFSQNRSAGNAWCRRLCATP